MSEYESETVSEEQLLEAVRVQQLLEAVRVQARELAAALGAAQDAGVSPAVLLPELVAVFRDAGLSV